MEEFNPYTVSAAEYLMTGWMPLPLPLGEKAPPPSGVTGWGGVYPEEETVLGEWMEQGGNIGLKMPPNVIGLDVDGEAGYRRFKALESQLGELPGEWMITSHESHTEGFTAFFTVPEGMQFNGQVSTNIDVIQSNHRYQTAPPSVHPDSGRVYEWRVYEGSTPLPFIPEADTLPPLPQAWIDFFSKSVDPNGVDATGVDPKDSSLTGVGCNLMNAIVASRVKVLKSGKVGRHDAMVLATWAIVTEAAKGHAGANEALAAYKKSWLWRFNDAEKKRRDLDNEFGRAVYGAMAKNSKTGNDCNCGKNAYKKRGITGSKDLKMWKV